MKQKLLWVGKALLCTVAALCAVYAGRIAAYYIMTLLFTNAGINELNSAGVPEALRFIWDNASDIGNITALIFGLCSVMWLKLMFPGEKVPLMGTHLFLGLMGAFVGIMLIRLLISLDFVRNGLAGSSSITAYILDFCLCAFIAALLRGCVTDGVNRAFGIVSACMVSAVLQAGAFALVADEITVQLLVNGLVSGAMFAFVYTGHRTILPEILMCTGLRIGARRVMGFPDIRSYTVSSEWLTGGVNGLEGSCMLLFMLIIVLFIYLLVKRRENLNGQKTTVSCKSLRRAKKG